MSPHFSLAELVASETAARRGIDNTPGPVELDNLVLLASRLEEVRMLLGNRPIIVSSGYRSPALNEAVGGAKNSFHMRGLAADFIAPRFGTPAEAVAKIAASTIDFDQCILEYGRWVHFAIAAEGRKGRRQVLRIG